MDSKNGLRHELAELNLLLRGLSQIPGFPAELLELISGKVESVSRLALRLDEQLVSDEQDLFSDENLPLEYEINEFNKVDGPFTIEGVSSCSDPSLSESVIKLQDQMTQRRLGDLTKSLTLNDRFRFQREFFGNDPQKMSEVFSAINKTQSKDEALEYLRGVCMVDEQSDCFQDFCLMLNLHFANGSDGSQSN